MAKTTKNVTETKAEECLWESGQLGNSAETAVASSAEHDRSVDDAMGLQMISIRLPKALIEDLKYLAEREGLGYQPLVRRVLMRYVSHEYKLIAHERFATSMATPTPAASDVEDWEDVRIAACG